MERIKRLYRFVVFPVFPVLFVFSCFSMSSDIDVSLSSNTPQYDNNQTVEILLNINNNSTASIDPVSVITDWLSIEVSADGGGSQKAFTALAISAENKFFIPLSKSSEGSFQKDKDLQVNDAALSFNGRIVYRIKATINDKINGAIHLVAKVNGEDSNQMTLLRVPYEPHLTKSAHPSSYKPGGNLVFSVRLDNKGSSTIKNATVRDWVSDVKSVDINDKKVPAFTKILSIESSTEGKGSDAGLFQPMGNLLATQVVVAAGGWVQYEMTVTVSQKLVGDIENDAQVEVREATTLSNTVIVPSAKENVSLKYRVKPVRNYKAGQDVNYLIQASNSGDGYAVNYSIVNELKSLGIQLANKNDDLDFSQTNVVDHPFSSWTVAVKHVDPNSTSRLSKTSPIKDDDLNDTVTLAPGEKITYQVSASTQSVSISTIDSKVSATSRDGKTILEKTLSLTALPLTTDISIVKTPVSSDYIPGGWVEYKIEVTNNDKNKFSDNFNIIDQISSCQKVEMVDGFMGPPFTEWKLSVDSHKGEGTDPGKFDFGVEKSGDLNLTADLSPGGKIIYKLQAKVDPKAIGTLLDNHPCPDSNVLEKGAGLDMPKGKSEVLKRVDQYEFVPGSALIYEIAIKNSGKGYLHKLEVKDELSKVLAGVAGGGYEKAFVSWKITTTLVGEDLSQSTYSNPDLDKTLSNDADINTHATIFPGDTILYKVVAVTKNTLTGPVTNKVTAGMGGHSEVTSTPKKYGLDISKTVNKWRYSEVDDSMTYRIVLTNEKEGGFAKDIAVDDDIQNVKAELLHPRGKSIPAFKSWEITAVTEGEGADAGINEDNYHTQGLHAKASLPAGGKITYTIVAKLQDRTQDKIVWGPITNVARATTDGGVISHQARTAPEVPDIQIAKTIDKPFYTAGEVVTYGITVKNVGAGYANNLMVTDSIQALGFFERWTIQHTAQGLGSRVVEGVSDNQDIRTSVDLAPGGSVHFEIKGTVISDISGIDKVTNTVKVYDPITDRDFEASADIDKNISTSSFSITKTASSVYFRPGETFTYTITGTNTSDQEVDNLILTDNLADIKTSLANARDGTHTQIEGTPFNRWRYKVENDAWSEWETRNVFLVGFSVGPKASKTMTIEVDIKDNVVSHKLANLVDVVRFQLNDNWTFSIQDLGHAKIESLRTDPGGRVVRSFTPARYKPGDEITYTINVTSNVGYFNDVVIKDALTNLRVQTIDGSFKHPFNDQFTVSVSKQDSHEGGTTDGIKDGIVQDNKDLDTIIDVGPGDKVTYTIKGVIREDAVGPIDNDGMISAPFDDQYTYTKTTRETNYIPGLPLHYVITLTNTGKSHLRDLPVKDMLSTLRVTDVDDNVVKALMAWTITHEQSPVKSAVYEKYYNAGKYENNQDIDLVADIPIGGKLVYTIAATVNPLAFGKITNLLDVDSNTTSVITASDVSNYKVTKDILGYFDKNHNPLGENAYMPGGYITYKIRIENTYGANVKDTKVTDALSKVKTKWFDGSRGKAFESWTIRPTTGGGIASDSGSVEDNADIDTIIDIGVGGFVEYEITAKIMEEAVGRITNNITVGPVIKKSDKAIMAKPKLVLSKEAYTDSSLTTIKDGYKPNDKVYYKVTLDNQGYGTLYNKTAKKSISDLRVEIAEYKNTYGSQPKAQPFKQWHVSDILVKGRVTNVGDFKAGDNVDINTAFDLAPLDKIEFIVEATIIDNALGKITTQASAGRKKASKVIAPDSSVVAFEKQIITLNGQPYSPENNKYKPGSTVVYQIMVSNAFDSWLNNVKVADNISDIVTGLSDGTTGSVFSTWSVKSEVATNEGSAPKTYVPAIAEKANIDFDLDIAPHETVIFTLKATIKSSAMGEITGNTLTVGRGHDTTQTLSPYESRLVSNKVALESTAGDIQDYVNNGLIKFRLTVENTGEGFAQYVQIKDPFDTLTSTDGQVAFKSDYQISIEDTGIVNSTIKGDYRGSVALNATANIAPGEKYSFLVAAHVNADVMGVIENALYVNGEVSSAVSWNPQVPVFVSEMVTDISSYAPGDTVTFTLKVTNASDTIGPVTVNALLSQMQVLAADGTMKQALNDVTLNAVIEGDEANSSIKEPALDAGKNLDTTITLPGNKTPGAAVPDYTSVIFTLSGKVREDAVGGLTNTAKVNGKEIALSAPVLSILPDIEITKSATATPAEYIPGEMIGFDIQLTNAGRVYSFRTYFEDLLANLKTEVIGSSTPEQVIVKWENVTVDFTSPWSYGNKEINDETGYSNNFVIRPGDSVYIHLEGRVDEKAIGSINNIAQFSEKIIGSKGEATASYSPSTATDIKIKKSTTKSTAQYEPGEMIGFDIAITNAGKGLATDVHIEDLLANLTTEVAGSSAVAQVIFKWENIKVAFSSPLSEAIAGKEINDATGYYNDFVIQPGDRVDIHLEGTVANNAMGTITNMAQFTEKDASGGTLTTGRSDARYTPDAVSLDYTKKSLKGKFRPGESVSFTISVINMGVGWGPQIPVIDDFSRIGAELFGGVTGKAFVDDTLTVTHDAAPDLVIMTVDANKLDAKVDVAPGATVIFTLAAQLNPEVVSAVTNIGTVDGTEINATITPELASVTLEKTASTDFYQVGETVKFDVVVSNSGTEAGIANDVLLTDAISKIQVIAADGTEKSAFSDWTITLQPNPNIVVLDSATGKPFVDLSNKDLDVKIDLLAKADAVFTIQGRVINDATGNITNRASVQGIDVDTTVIPAATTWVSSKISDIATYQSGNELSFTLSIKNTSKNVIYEQLLIDDLEALQVGLTDATMGNAFKAGTTSLVPKDVPATATAEKVDNKTYKVTLLPNDEITFTAKGEVVDKAVGPIQNTASFNDESFESNQVPAEKPALAYTKEALQDMFSSGDNVSFTITLTNTGKGWGLQIPVIDDFSLIEAELFGGVTGKAFIDNTLTVTHDAEPGLVNMTVDANELDAWVDVPPESMVTFTLTAQLNEKIVSTVTNTGTVDGVVVNATIIPILAAVALRKTTDTDRYQAGGIVKFDVTVFNPLPGVSKTDVANDILLVDEIKKVQVITADGTEKPAFSDWTITLQPNPDIVVLDNTTNELFVDTRNEDLDVKIDMLSNSKVIFTIEARVIDDALGDINNKAAVTYHGLTAGSNVTVPPDATTFVSSKISDIAAYQSGNELSFTLSIKNTSKNVIYEQLFIDDLEAIQIRLADGTTGNAFNAGTTSLIPKDIPSTATAEKVDDKTYKLILLPDDEITFTAKGVVVHNAVGLIQNTASFNDESFDSNQVPPEKPVLEYTKKALQSTFGVGDTVSFTITLKNTGIGWGLQIPVIDDFSRIEAELFGGVTGKAFVDNTLTVTHDANPDLVKMTVDANKLDALVNVPPSAVVTFTLTAQMEAEVVSAVTNIGTVDGVDVGATVTPAVGVVGVLKIASHVAYQAGESVKFEVTVLNPLSSTMPKHYIAMDVSLVDEISAVLVATADGAEKPAFSDWTITLQPNPEIVVTDNATNKPFVDTSNEDLNVKIDMLSNSKALFTIEAVVVNDAMGSISNVAAMEYNKDTKSSHAIISPGSTTSVSSKVSDSPTYQSGNTLSFTLSVKNTSKNVIYEQVLVDDLEALQVELVDGTMANAFKTGTIGLIPKDIPATATAEKVDDKTYKVTLLPDDEITFTAKGEVVDSAVGLIQNTASFNNEAFESNQVPAEKPVLTYTKSALKDTFSLGETVSFAITLTNTGKGWASQTPVADDFSRIEAELIGGVTGKAFVDNTLTVTHDADPADVSMSVESNRMDATVNVPPESVVTFTLTAQLNGHVVSDVTNIAYVEDGVEINATITLELAKVTLEKTVNPDVYHVDEMIKFDVIVSNLAVMSIANDVLLADEITQIKVIAADGTKKPAFSDWTITLQPDPDIVVLNNTTNQPFVDTRHEDLDVKIDLLPRSKAVFTIEARVINDAVGDITNAAEMNYEGNISNVPAFVSPDLTIFVSSKASDESNYTPDKPLSFTIAIKNTSKNVIYEQLLIDDLEALQVELTDGTTGNAFKAGTTRLTPKDMPATAVVEKIDDKTYKVTLLPDDVITFTAKGDVVDHATGVIQNKATFNDEGFDSNEVASVTPEIVGEFTVVQKYYIPGEPLEYHLTLTNNSDFSVFDMPLNTQFLQSEGVYITGGMGRSFDSGTNEGDTDDKPDSDSDFGSVEDNKDINTHVSIEAGGFVRYIIKPDVDINMTTIINVNAFYSLGGASTSAGKSALSVPYTTKLAADPVPPGNGVMVVTKKSDKDYYGEVDKIVKYTLTAVNEGTGNLGVVTLFDDLKGLENAKGRAFFKSWKFTMYKNDILVDTDLLPPNENLDMPWTFIINDTVKIIIEATINSGLDDDVTNVFQANYKATDDAEIMTPVESESTIHITKNSQGEGELRINKTVKQPQIQPGSAVEYEIVVENPNDSAFDNFTLEDHYPAGFRYIENSARISDAPASGEAPSSAKPITPEVSSVLVFRPLDLAANGKLRITYVLKAGIGVTFGNYKNTAYATFEKERISNKDSAIVAIIGDKLFDTAAIIGKVFEDHNGNGYQSDATAKNLRVTAKIDPQNYIAGSTILEYGNQKKALPDAKQPAINKGIVIKALAGKSGNRPDQTSKAVVTFKTRTDKTFPMTVTTSSGTNIILDTKGKFEKMGIGDVKKGLSNEDLHVTRNLYKQDNGYLWEIIIENHGDYDEGIPGVRIITCEGFKVETDAYGRYHIPDRWVLDKKGKNFLVKVDTDSLPGGMSVISENPKVLRLTPNHLSKFNFSVQRDKKTK